MVFKFDPQRLRREYGIDCHRLFPVADRPTPFGATWCEIPATGTTAPHHHPDGETFYIFRGRGRMTVEGKTWEVGPGDAVYLAPFSNHVLENLSAEARLLFLSVWWEREVEEFPALPKRALVAVAPPTPNGDLHLGHLSGPYLAADSFTRALRLFGVDASLLAGSDDNQSYVLAKARALGQAPESVANDFSDSIRATFESAGMRVDDYLTPLRDERYVEFVQAFFARLVADGAIELREVPELYCAKCARVLYEAFVGGGCPHCGAATSGHGCEGCGILNQAVDLHEPRCRGCGEAPSRRTAMRYVFPLSRHADALRAYYERTGMPNRLRAYTQRLLAQGLEDFSASFETPWGIRVPGRATHAINVWVEMAAGYLYFAEKRKREDRWAPFGPTNVAGEKTASYAFFGFDNAYFYTALIPAVMLAWNPGTELTARWFTNEFFTLNGLKFSTSRNHAVWAPAALAGIAPDAVRIFLAANRPENAQTDFTWDAFEQFVRTRLAGQWEAWMAGVESTAREVSEGRAPAADLTVATSVAFYEELKRALKAVERAYRPETFSLVDAVAALDDLVRRARRFSDTQKFTSDPQARRAALALELLAVKSFALAARPVMPATSERVLAAIGVPGDLRWEALPTLLPTGTPVARMAPTVFSDAIPAIAAFRKTP